MFIQTEPTPNPATLKFLPGREVLGSGAHEFASAEDAATSPLASALFAVDGVRAVMFGPDFLTVSKDDAVAWEHLKPALLGAIMDHFVAGNPVFVEGAGEAAGRAEGQGHAAGTYDEETQGIVDEIKELLDTRVRPAVAQDGGDITFQRFEKETGLVYLTMRGACSGCPSSIATLKGGIENLLKHYVPEVTAVEAVG